MQVQPNKKRAWTSALLTHEDTVERKPVMSKNVTTPSAIIHLITKKFCLPFKNDNFYWNFDTAINLRYGYMLYWNNLEAVKLFYFMPFIEKIIQGVNLHIEFL